MASETVRAQYVAAGIVFLERARKQFSGLSDIEALCCHAEARTGVLKGTTVNLYRQQYNAVLEELAAAGNLQPAETAACRARIETALARVRGRPPAPNTSTKKVKDAQDWMVMAVFGRLKLMALRHDRVRLAATALYCLLQPFLGTRPTELQHAYIDGDMLIVRNAKRADKSSRSLDLTAVHPTHRMALLVLIEIIKVEIAELGYERWLKTLAENLARACEAASTKQNPIPRLSPTSFRHTAISTWSAAGYTVEEIAELAGHLSLLSARRHYIHEGAAWALSHAGGIRPGVLPELDQTPIAEVAAAEPPILEDFPDPPPKADTASAGDKLWAEFSARLARQNDPPVRLPAESPILQPPRTRRSR